MERANDPILIIGAGIGGLTAARSLQQFGLRPLIYEQTPDLGDIGAGITMYPNATRVLEFLGLGPAMEATAVNPVSGGGRHWQTGEFLRVGSAGPTAREIYGAPYYFMHRADLHDALVDAARDNDPECIHLAHSFVDFEETADGVTARFENGATVRGRALIGCDGIRSRVRELLWGADEPRFTGKVAWRGLVPIELLPEDQQTLTSCLWTGPGHAFLRYPVRRGTLMNYVAHTAQGAWAEESWRLQTDVGELLAEYDGWDPNLLDFIRLTPPELCFKWALFDRDPLPEWSKGRVTLLGDAAHPALPFLGQGAGMAIEDGMVLARCLEMDGDVPAALQRYEAARKPRCHFVQLESRANGDRMFERDPAKRFVDGRAEEQAKKEGALRHYDAMTVEL